MIGFILVNAISLGIEAEWNDVPKKEWKTLYYFLKAVDWICAMVFFIEIILKWADDFWTFWKRKWDIADFLITVLSFVPTLMMTIGSNVGTMEVFRVFKELRLLRTFKTVARSRRAQFVAQTIYQTTKDLSPFLVFLLVLLFVFSEVAVEQFHKYPKESDDRNYFNDIAMTMCTLSIIFTFDHWTDVLRHIVKKTPEEDHPYWTGFIVLWLVIASIFISNMMLCIVVKNVQSFRTHLDKENKGVRVKAEKDIAIAKRVQRSVELAEARRAGRESPASAEEDSPDWENLRQYIQTEGRLWDQDRLLRFFELIEDLQRHAEKTERLRQHFELCLQRFELHVSDRLNISMN
ncbi:cation channel sperm-associated protein 2-like [Myripristis murdjan]|uniref:cation channel sperm-associated protein 2-like n=1 Tax=Myripristis murdjan TaxID=586833 RepID=UPI0011764186|nr:cation channel sperm-associated protein 2-like [Myripristis murdjan]